MTAFSRFSVPLEEGLITIEIQSLNRKHLEIQTILPREFLEFDSFIKKQIQKRIVRGKLHLYLTFVPHEKCCAITRIPNVALAKEIQKGWNEISKHLGIKESESGLLRLLSREPALFETQVSQDFFKTLETSLGSALEKTLDQLCLMKEKEGAFLKEEFEKRIEILSELILRVDHLNENSAQQQQEKLKQRIEKLLEDKLEKDERFFKEVALLADKADTTEEITRIKSHLKQFKQALEASRKGHGKLLDFMTQELNREWNTIGAKCTDHQVSNYVLEAKSECEKIREQIHNIE